MNNMNESITKIAENKSLAKEIEKEERAELKEKLKKYKKFGAERFQQVVFKVESLKFKALKKVCPNFIKYFDKYIDFTTKKKIKQIKRKESQRDNIEKNHPTLLKVYDKYILINEKVKLHNEERKEKLRKKVKATSPKLLNFYDEYFKSDDSFSKLTLEDKIRELKERSKFSKMIMRKEFLREQNRNYHMDPKKPTEIYKYLEWNKKVHMQGLTQNFILIPILTGLSLASINWALPILLIELISAGINFECINIQNYNMCRFKLTEKALKKQEERITTDAIKKHGEASKVIYKSMEKTDNLPTISEIIGNINDREQLLQLREMIKNSQKERAVEMNRGNKK